MKREAFELKRLEEQGKIYLPRPAADSYEQPVQQKTPQELFDERREHVDAQLILQDGMHR